MPGLTLTLKDEREQPEGDEVSFYYPNGLADFVTYLNRDSTPVHPVIYRREDVESRTPKGEPQTISFEIAFQYVEENTGLVLSYATTHETPDGGTHLTGLLRTILGFTSGWIKEEGKSENHLDVVEETFIVPGLTAVVHVILPHPNYEGATNRRLINPDAEHAVFRVTANAIHEFAQQHPEDMQRLIDHLIARKAERNRRRFGEA